MLPTSAATDRAGQSAQQPPHSSAPHLADLISRPGRYGAVFKCPLPGGGVVAVKTMPAESKAAVNSSAAVRAAGRLDAHQSCELTHERARGRFAV